MPNDELLLLREENERLRLLVDLLSDKLNSIRALVQLDGAFDVGMNMPPSSLVAGAAGTMQVSSSHVADNAGRKQMQYSNDAGNAGMMQVPYSHVAGDNGMTQVPSSHVAGYRGMMAAPSSYVAGDNGAIPIDIDRLRTLLRPEMFRCSSKTCGHAAKILVQLYISPKNTFKTFCRLTGLTEGGMAKHIMGLKRRGLIVRTGFQQYALTQKSLKLLEKSWEGA